MRPCHSSAAQRSAARQCVGVSYLAGIVSIRTGVTLQYSRGYSRGTHMRTHMGTHMYRAGSIALRTAACVGREGF